MTDAGLVSVTLSCRGCGGSGVRRVVSCRACRDLAELAFLPARPVRHFPPRYADTHDAFPCGHPVRDEVAGQVLEPPACRVVCTACGGVGAVTRRLTPEAAARKLEREARRRKRLDSLRTLFLLAHGERAAAEVLWPLCGHETRAADKHPCPRRVVPGSTACPSHGGLSTGPKTPEGRAAVRASNRRRGRLRG